MKTPVDTLIKVLELRKDQASRELQNALVRLDELQKELEAKMKAKGEAEGNLESAQRRGAGADSISLHGRWIDNLYQCIKQLSNEIQTQESHVVYCQGILEGVYLELKALQQYQQTIHDRHKAVIAGLESKELDEIAGQKHSREAPGFQ